MSPKHIYSPYNLCVYYPSNAIPELQDLLPSIINQLGPDNLANLKKIAESYKKDDTTGGDDDIPDLVENFEAVSTSDASKPAADASKPAADASKPAEETKQ
jgi:nascent polypeptide-associated complex subunit beta